MYIIIISYEISKRVKEFFSTRHHTNAVRVVQLSLYWRGMESHYGYTPVDSKITSGDSRV